MVRTKMPSCDFRATPRKPGRPKDPKSEASTRPWEKLKIGRTSYYVRKRYGGLTQASATAHSSEQ